MLRQPGKDGRHLGRGLARPEDHFRHSVAQGAMVVHIGESQVFEGKMAQAVDGGVGRKLALADLLEEFADGIGVQGGTQPSASQHSANARLD